MIRFGPAKHGGELERKKPGCNEGIDGGRRERCFVFYLVRLAGHSLANILDRRKQCLPFFLTLHGKPLVHASSSLSIRNHASGVTDFCEQPNFVFDDSLSYGTARAI